MDWCTLAIILIVSLSVECEKTNKHRSAPDIVTNIYLDKFTLSADGNGLDVFIQWDRIEDKTCSYNLFYHSTEYEHESEGVKVIHFNESKRLYRHQLKQLAFETKYAIGIEALNGKNALLKSQILWHALTTPSCLEFFKGNVSLCGPHRPENITVIVDYVASNIYKFNVSWKKPKNFPDNYTIEFIDYESQIKQNFTISNGTINSVLFDVKFNGSDYEILVIAHSTGGSSSNVYFGKIDRTITHERTNVVYSNAQIIAFVTIFAIASSAAMIVLIKVILYQRAKSIRDQKRNLYFKELEEKSPNESSIYEYGIRTKEQLDQIYALQSDFNFAEDEMEVDPKRIQTLEIIGEGAFGCVRRAILDSKHTVAVKMLKVHPVYEDVKSFYGEIQVMKSVPRHPNIVGIVGHCTKNIYGLMLFTEYCSEGNLLNFLRKIYDNNLLQAVGTLSKVKHPEQYDSLQSRELRKDSASTTSSSISIIENLGYAFDSSTSRMCIVENHGYGFDIGNNQVEKPITDWDLLWFAHQVANGMEFLSANKVVHRDLACRNVLVLSDRTVKISDFGLSRDIYQDNLYKKSGSGMLPVKWLAIESMTRQVYTTQSDVWSFGVLLYEIITKGAVPYPTIDAKDILKFLLDGQRMERPNGCRPDVYQLMLRCWRSMPADRPTFQNIKVDLQRIMDDIKEENVP